MQLLIVIVAGLPLVAVVDLRVQERITNGRLAHRYQFPYQVGLLLRHWNFTSWCGGSLIGNTWVLTAAHCFRENVTSTTVELGSKTRFKPFVSYIVDSKAIIVHPEWNRKTAMNDIALVKIPPVTYNADIRPVKLPAVAPSYSSYRGQYVIASGWGKTSDSPYQNSTNELYYAGMRVLSNDFCRRTYQSFITDSKVCVSTYGGRSTCHGDSGGPLVLKSTNELIGVSSFTLRNGCTMNHPAVFSRVTSYLRWIKDQTGITG